MGSTIIQHSIFSTENHFESEAKATRIVYMKGTRRFVKAVCGVYGNRYPLSCHIITPYPESQTSDSTDAAMYKRQFNHIHSSTRMSIERAFGILVSCWRILLHHVFMRDIKDIVQIITACCILHNLCIDMGEYVEIDRDMLVNEGDNYEEGASVGRSGVSRSEGQRYRDTLLQGLRDDNII